MFNRNKTRTITWARSEHGEYDVSNPLKPAIKFLPEWYRKARNTVDNSKQHYTYEGKLHPFPAEIDPKTQTGATFKRCVPTLDALTFGYMLSTTDDIYFNESSGMFDETPQVQQHTHTPYEFEGYPLPTDTHERVFKWNSFLYITVPDGYTVLYTHPLHRYDLPFQTLPAVIDLDKHPLEINIPFVMKKGFSGLIPKNTPVAQLIPIKREPWKAEEKPFRETTQKIISEFFDFNERGEPTTGVYKRKVRSKKDFN